MATGPRSGDLRIGLKVCSPFADTVGMYRHGDYTHDYDALAAAAAAQVVPAPSRVLAAGDFHGAYNHINRIVLTAKNAGIDTILQVGDFGYWVHNAKDNRALKSLSRTLVRDGIIIVFVDGNHENFEALLQDRPVVPGTAFRIVAPNILYAPRGARWEWAGVRFLALGGAASADIDHRRAAEAKRRKSEQRTRWFWWHEETITDADVDLAIAGGPVDVLVAHDAPSSSNLKPHVAFVRDGYKEDPATWENRGRVQRVVEHTRPRLVLHGHYHTRYDGECGGFDFSARVKGLGANISKDFADSYIILDLNDIAGERSA